MSATASRGDPSGPNKSRGAGWDFVHVCIDDHSRVAFSEIKPDETADSAVSFLKAAVAYYKTLGVTVTRVMTDNGSCYQSFAFRDACRDLGIKHIRQFSSNSIPPSAESWRWRKSPGPSA
ncbi:transposase InsO family protein [Bradyrhizobium sp. F1.4.3]